MLGPRLHGDAYAPFQATSAWQSLWIQYSSASHHVSCAPWALILDARTRALKPPGSFATKKRKEGNQNDDDFGHI